jgi:hypothetical protein
MSTENEDVASRRVLRKNEKFNVPDQTEKEEAEHMKMLTLKI